MQLTALLEKPTVARAVQYLPARTEQLLPVLRTQCVSCKAETNSMEQSPS